MLQTSDILVVCRSYGTTIPLLSLKISLLYTVPNRFYEFLNVENQMCELRMHVFPNPVTYVTVIVDENLRRLIMLLHTLINI